MKKMNLNPQPTRFVTKTATTSEASAQTDDRLLIENAKNLNEKLKKRHLESSTSDSTGVSENLDENESRPRRRRLKKRRVKSGTSGDERNELHANIDGDLVQTDEPIKEINPKLKLPLKDGVVVNGNIDHDNEEDDGYNLDDYIIQNKSHDRIDDGSILEPNIELSVDEDQILEPQCILREDSDDQSPEFSDIEPEQPSDADGLESKKDKTKRTAEDVEEIRRDKEIERLTNLTTLDMKRKNAENQKPQQQPARKAKKPDGMMDIINDADKAGDDITVADSSSDEESTMSEDKFLRQKNQEVKQRLLNSSESDVSSNFDESDLELKTSESESEENGESSDGSRAMDTFLDKMNQKGMESDLKLDKNVANGVAVVRASDSKGKSVESGSATESKLKVRNESELKPKNIELVKESDKIENSEGDMIVNAAFDMLEKTLTKQPDDYNENADIDDAISTFLKEDSEIGEILNRVR